MRPDGGIVKAPLITNRAERSEAVRNPDAEANIVPEAAPGCRQGSALSVNPEKPRRSRKSPVIRRW